MFAGEMEMRSPPDLCGRKINPKLADGGVMLFKRFFTDNTIYIVKPTTILRDSTSNESIPASDLKVRSETTSQHVQCHFEKVLLGEVFKEQEPKKELEDAVCELLKKGMPLKHSLTPAIQRCKADVFENLSLLKNGIRNEANLRFALADPILRLLCSYWNFTVCCEG